MNRKWLNNIPRDIGFYLSGFVDGEGSFNISLRKKDDYHLGWQVVLSFNVSQKDPTLLYLLKRHLGCGIIKKRKDDELYSYDVTNPNSIIERVIPFFKKFNFLSSSKKRNFSLFVKASKLMLDKEHLNEEGLREIVEIREKINIGAGRTRKYTIKDVFPSEESSETTCQTL